MLFCKCKISLELVVFVFFEAMIVNKMRIMITNFIRKYLINHSAFSKSELQRVEESEREV